HVYPLSLHDALPISRRDVAFGVEHDDRVVGDALDEQAAVVPGQGRQGQSTCSVHHAAGLPITLRSVASFCTSGRSCASILQQDADRKSTRLNSSHVK